MCSNTVTTRKCLIKKGSSAYLEKKGKESMSLHFPHAPDYISVAKWLMLLSFPEFGSCHASAEVNANFSLSPLKQSAWIKASSMQA